jgi:TctA family transporter
MAFRQSLAMSGGDYSIFLERPIAVTLLAIGAAVLLLGLVPPLWRRRLRGSQAAQ